MAGRIPDDAEFRCVCSNRDCVCSPERDHRAANWCPRVALVAMCSPIYNFIHRMCLPCAEHAQVHRGYREVTDFEIEQWGL